MIARLALAAAMFALPAAAMAQSADKRPCITPDQNEAVTAYVMPSLATEMARKCAPSLGQRSYLVTNAQRLSPGVEHFSLMHSSIHCPLCLYWHVP